MNARVSNLEHDLVPVAAGTGVSFTVSNSALDSPTFIEAAERATYVLVSVRSNAVLVTTDRADPTTAGVGVYRAASVAPFVMSREAFRKAKWLRATGSDGIVYAEPMVAQN